MKNQTALLILFISSLVFMPYAAIAQEDIGALKKQIEGLQKRVEELEAGKSADSTPSGSFFNRRSGWDPFSEMQRMQEEMDRMFQDSFIHKGNTKPGIFSSSLNFGADVDLKETKEGYEVVFDMTGLNKDKVDIQINEHSITVKGERSSEERQENDNGFFQSQSFGTFMKTIPLPVDADTTKINTEKEGDSLVIRIPKKTT